MPGVEAFFREIDALWKEASTDRIVLGIIGSSALMLQVDYMRGTKDSDVLETTTLTRGTKQRLLDLAGEGTPLHDRHKLHIDLVPNGLPFLPQAPVWHKLVELNASLGHLELQALDVVDVVVSKLKRLNANDVSDIEAMVDMDLVPHDRLLARFRSAVDFYSMDARSDDLPKYIANLHRVERDLYAVSESEIDLPSWI